MPSSLDLTLGAVEMGAMMSMMLYGMFIVQVYTYAKDSKTDRAWLKALVAFVWCLETLHIAAMLTYVYYLTVTKYADVTAIGGVKWFTVVSIILSTVVGTPVQIYFTYRAWLVSGRSWFATLPWIAEAVRFGIIMASCIYLSQSSTLQEFRVHHGWLVTTTLISCVLVDLYNSVVLCYYLRRQRVTFEPTMNFVNAIIVWSVETSLTGCTFAAFAIVFWLALPNTLLWLCVNLIHGKVYSNSMMLSLNARIIRKAQHTRPAALPRSWDVQRPDSSMPSSARSPVPTTDLYTPDYPQYALVHRDSKFAAGSPTPPPTLGYNYPPSPPARAELARLHA